ncbi:MAG: aldehyde dehydrogenase family protein, partial [Candidatus Thermoplasmatota archaeon]|nr:aldehyde dehydrogenase family protein [Candidatus Thermoplasmatota archaeon]
MVEEYGVYINGEWVDSSGEELFDVINPANGETLARFPRGTREDVHRALDAAMEAFPGWKGTPPVKRGEVLLRASQILRDKKDKLSKLLVRENGKVIAEARGEVQEAIDFFEYIAGEGRRLLGETVATELPDKFAMTVRLPAGIAGLITPWNFPIAIPSWKIGAAIVSGCTMIFKPATGTPILGAKLVSALEAAGLPPGILNMVTGRGSEVGEEIVTNPMVSVVSFTGGLDTGREVYT